MNALGKWKSLHLKNASRKTRAFSNEHDTFFVLDFQAERAFVLSTSCFAKKLSLCGCNFTQWNARYTFQHALLLLRKVAVEGYDWKACPVCVCESRTGLLFAIKVTLAKHVHRFHHNNMPTKTIISSNVIISLCIHNSKSPVSPQSFRKQRSQPDLNNDPFLIANFLTSALVFLQNSICEEINGTKNWFVFDPTRLAKSCYRAVLLLKVVNKAIGFSVLTTDF